MRQSEKGNDERQNSKEGWRVREACENGCERLYIERCSLANEFLKNLATQNSGRYLCVSQRHASDGAFDAHLFAHQLVENNFADPEVRCSFSISARFLGSYSKTRSRVTLLIWSTVSDST